MAEILLRFSRPNRQTESITAAGKISDSGPVHAGSSKEQAAKMVASQ